LFSFIGCEYTELTKQYIEQSSRAINYTSSPLDTTRNSKTLYIEAMKKVDHEMIDRFFKAARMFWTLSTEELQTYKDFIEKYVKK